MPGRRDTGETCRRKPSAVAAGSRLTSPWPAFPASGAVC